MAKSNLEENWKEKGNPVSGRRSGRIAQSFDTTLTYHNRQNSETIRNKALLQYRMASKLPDSSMDLCRIVAQCAV